MTTDPLDEAVAVLLGDVGAYPTEWLIDWLIAHPDRAEELARFLTAERSVAGWAAPLRDLLAYDEGLTAAYPSQGEAHGVSVPGYTIEGELGRGGMGVVYAAVQVAAGRPVALKTIRTGAFASPRDAALFRLEAATAAALDHPNIVPVYEVGEHGGVLYFSMKRFASTLAQRLRRGPLAAEEVARLGAVVARAVHHAHRLRVVHRDLKPGNILLDEVGEPHVADFGLARRLDASTGLTVSGTVTGTAEYMAPEQARGERQPTEAIDVYGLGGILYAGLTGRPPFRGPNPLDTMAQVQFAPVRPPREVRPDVPADLERICLRCLAKDPADRYPSAEAVAEDLDRFLRGEALGDRPAVFDRLWKVLTRPPHVPGLATLPALWWMTGLDFARHAGVFLLGWYGAAVGWVWLLFLAMALGCTAILWRSHVASPRALVTRAEFASLTFAAGSLVGQVLLLVAATLSLPGALASPTAEVIPRLYPGLAVAIGLAIFAHGVTHWGAFYLAGVGVMLLALPLSLLPAWSPLILGTVTIFLVVTLGGALNRQVARMRAAAHTPESP